MPTLLIAIDPSQLPADTEAVLRAAAPGYDILLTHERSRIEAVLDDVEIAAGWMPKDLPERMPRLKWLQLWSAGADWLPRHPALVAHPAVVTTAVGIHGVQIGEHVFATLLALARDLPKYVLAQHERRWRPDDEARPRVFELHGRTLLVVGVGAIGARVAALGSAFGMRVMGVRRQPEKTVAGVERMVGEAEMDSVLPQADVVVLTLPLTDATRGMFDARRLALLPPGGLFVNIGRGGTVDEIALSAALTSGQLRGAALDVTSSEPLKPESPLWDTPNLLLTAHSAGMSPKYHERARALFLDNLGRFLGGRPLHNVVDKALGM